jgi:integrase
MAKRRKRRGLRLDDYVVSRLAAKRCQYTVWDLAVEGCGVRVSRSTKSCVISVRIGTAKKFETIGRVLPDQPYEYLRELAIRRIRELRRQRLSRLPLRPAGADSETLSQALESYVIAHPELATRTIQGYRKVLHRAVPWLMDQPVVLLVAPEILRLNQEHLEQLTKKDPVNKPPIGFWSWQSVLRTLRAVLCWHAAQKERTNPWPHARALRIRAPTARELPVELQSIAGRRRLKEGLRAIDSTLARAVMFICYTGIRRGAAGRLSANNLLANGVLEFTSKKRVIRIPLSRQAAALLDPSSMSGLLRVGDKRLAEPLTKIFGERQTPRGKRACVTPHDLRRYFKSVGAELGIDPTVMNLLVGHTVKGIDRHYVAKLRLSVLRAAAQKIANEIDDPMEIAGDNEPVLIGDANQPNVQTFESYLHPDVPSSLDALRPTRHAHYLSREDLYRLVWTAPVSEIAQRMGVSDVGLAKACRRSAIPVPSRGYWARVEAGQPFGRPALPPVAEGVPELVRIRARKLAPSSKLTIRLRPGPKAERPWDSVAPLCERGDTGQERNKPRPPHYEL